MATPVIRPIEPAQPLTSIEPLKPSEKSAGGFGKLVTNFTKEVSEIQEQAADQVARLAEGKVDNIHQVMIALGKAEITFSYMMAIRNKLVEAYKEVMRMPV